MSITVSFQKKPEAGADTAIVGVYKDNRLSSPAENIDQDHGGLIRHYLKKQKKFTGKKGQILTISAPQDSEYTRIILIGYGDAAKLDKDDCETNGGKLYLSLSAAGATGAHFFVQSDQAREKVTTEDMAAHTAMGLILRSYKFDKYKSKSGDEDESVDLERFEIISDAAEAATNIYSDLDSVSKGTFLARDLVNEPPNALYPESFAKTIKDELAPLGVEIEVFDTKKMQKLGFHALLAVGKGSERSAYTVVMRWKGKKIGGGKSKDAPLAFVGKGVTFDTGGINLKPSSGMGDMKLDMGGAAAVVGLMKSLALRKSSADVVGIVGLVENMPSHMAYRPSDVIDSLSGKTIEIMNTDAEGRLVLADCMTYVQRTYKPRLMIDLATLTGAMMMALGSDYCGTFVNNNYLWAQLDEAGAQTGEKLWRMPLDKAFKKDMESKIGDLKTLGGMGPYAGACTAAGFLEHFVEDDRVWAHMDIAGTAWIKADKPTCPKPGTGFGVRVLDRFIANNYE